MPDHYPYDLVILGGGATAFAAITGARRRGLSTAMVNTGLPVAMQCACSEMEIRSL